MESANVAKRSSSPRIIWKKPRHSATGLRSSTAVESCRPGYGSGTHLNTRRWIHTESHPQPARARHTGLRRGGLIRGHGAFAQNVLAHLTQTGVAVIDMVTTSPGLEDVFLTITGRTMREAH